MYIERKNDRLILNRLVSCCPPGGLAHSTVLKFQFNKDLKDDWGHGNSSVPEASHSTSGAL
jgi:hypothetical protein